MRDLAWGRIWRSLFLVGIALLSVKLEAAQAHRSASDQRACNKALFDAIDNREERDVKVALAKGADPNAKAEDRRTAVQYAMDNGVFSALPALLSSGAKLNNRDTILWDLLKLRATSSDIVDRVRFVRLLVKHGASVNKRCEGRRTVLITVLMLAA